MEDSPERHEALLAAAKIYGSIIPEEWRDPRMDNWLELCARLEEARRAEGVRE